MEQRSQMLKQMQLSRTEREREVMSQLDIAPLLCGGDITKWLVLPSSVGQLSLVSAHELVLHVKKELILPTFLLCNDKVRFFNIIDQFFRELYVCKCL